MHSHEASKVLLEDSMGIIDLPADYTIHGSSTGVMNTPAPKQAKINLEEEGEKALEKVDKAIKLHDKLHLHHLLSKKTIGEQMGVIHQVQVHRA